MEIVVSLVLVATALILIVGLIPMNANSLKRSESIQAATLYAIEMLTDAESVAFIPSDLNMNVDREVTINQTTYRVERAIYGVDDVKPPRLYDVVVKVSWNTQAVPVVLRTRVYHP